MCAVGLCLGCEPDSPSYSDLTFLLADAPVVALPARTHETVAFGPGELGSVPDLLIDRLTVDFTSDVLEDSPVLPSGLPLPNGETCCDPVKDPETCVDTDREGCVRRPLRNAEIFATDPEAYYASARHYAWGADMTAPLDEHDAVVANRGVTVEVPYMYRNSLPFSATSNRADLDRDWFHAPIQGIESDGRVHAARIVDHGLCSAATGLGGMLEPLLESAWLGFAGAANLYCTDAIQDFQRVETYLSHAEGDPRDTRGGLLVSGRFRADINLCQVTCVAPLPGCVVDCPSQAQADYSYSYELGLDDGILSATPLRHHLQVTVPQEGLVSLLVTGLVDIPAQVTKYLEVTAPQSIRAQALEAQSPGLPASVTEPLQNIFDTDASCQEAADCNGIASVFSGLVFDGAEALQLDQSDRDLLATEAGNHLVHWRCADPAPPFADGQCRPILRAKRLNMHPDAVELVWFDDLATTLPEGSPVPWVMSLAAYVAAFSPALRLAHPEDPTLLRRQLTRSLCRFNHPAPAVPGGAPPQGALVYPRYFLRAQEGPRIIHHGDAFCSDG